MAPLAALFIGGQFLAPLANTVMSSARVRGSAFAERARMIRGRRDKFSQSMERGHPCGMDAGRPYRGPVVPQRLLK
eukprot:15375827-Alexandrium_andersonii.AAC.1